MEPHFRSCAVCTVSVSKPVLRHRYRYVFWHCLKLKSRYNCTPREPTTAVRPASQKNFPYCLLQTFAASLLASVFFFCFPGSWEPGRAKFDTYFPAHNASVHTKLRRYGFLSWVDSSKCVSRGPSSGMNYRHVVEKLLKFLIAFFRTHLESESANQNSIK